MAILLLLTPCSLYIQQMARAASQDSARNSEKHHAQHHTAQRYFLSFLVSRLSYSSTQVGEEEGSLAATKIHDTSTKPLIMVEIG